MKRERKSDRSTRGHGGQWVKSVAGRPDTEILRNPHITHPPCPLVAIPRPLLALAGVAILVAVLAIVPATREMLDHDVLDPLRAQAAPAAGVNSGYSVLSLAFWAILGAVLAWAAYDLVFVRWGLEPDKRFFLAIAPLLIVGPLGHALLIAGEIKRRTALAWFVSEPLVYLSVAVLAVAGIAAGRVVKRPHAGLYAAGALALAPLLVLAARSVNAADLGRVFGILVVAGIAAAAVTLGVRKMNLPAAPIAIFAVVSAHALDGTSTWLGLRDPFGWGFGGMRESNPLAERLVGISNGWPYFAIKLALPILLLVLIRPDAKETPNPAESPRDEATETRMRAFLLFAVFVLGYGPGMSNLLQVLLA